MTDFVVKSCAKNYAKNCAAFLRSSSARLTFERALNALIAQGQEDLAPLEGKIIRLCLQDLTLEMDFLCVNNRLFVLDDGTQTPDIQIATQHWVLLDLLQGVRPTELLKADKITIHGDVKTAQLLLDLLKNSRLDLEELVSHWSGDIVAHQLGKIAKVSAKFSAEKGNKDGLLASLKDGLTQWIVAPSKIK